MKLTEWLTRRGHGAPGGEESFYLCRPRGFGVTVFLQCVVIRTRLSQPALRPVPFRGKSA